MYEKEAHALRRPLVDDGSRRRTTVEEIISRWPECFLQDSSRLRVGQLLYSADKLKGIATVSAMAETKEQTLRWCHDKASLAAVLTQRTRPTVLSAGLFQLESEPAAYVDDGYLP